MHDLVVTRCLGQPQRLRVAREAVTKICQAPANLRAQIALIAKRQDRVTVGLGERVTMTGTL